MFKTLYLKFLNGISHKFYDYFRQDPLHTSVYNLARQENLNAFLHLIECCLAKIAKLNCNCCTENNHTITATKLGIFSKQLAIFFSSYFGCALFVCDRLFSSFKYSVFTLDGMHLFDMNVALVNFFKHFNKLKRNKIYYVGIYNEKEQPELFSENVNFINFCTQFSRFAILGIVGTILEPKHFYSILVDKQENCIFFYNSCPKNNVTLYKRFNTWFPNMKIFYNKHQNQFDTELCGFYASQFLASVGYADNTISEFENFDINKNFDSFIFEKQKDFVLPLKENQKLVQLFFDTWSNKQ
jgi:hypothetical protein